MSSSSTLERLKDFRLRNFILSLDTIAGIIAFFVLYIVSDGSIDQATGLDIASNIAVVSSTLFAIVLTGFTIITSFTDRYFLYAWKKLGKFEGIVTLFQYNLFLPILVLVISFALQIRYHGLGAIFLIAIFVYMLFSLLNLVGFISTYALQRAEFVSQVLDKQENSNESQESDRPNLSTEQLEDIRRHLSNIDEVEDES